MGIISFNRIRLSLDFYSSGQFWKFAFLFVAVIIGAGSLLYTNSLVNKLSAEELKKVELWADATRKLSESSQQYGDLDFLLRVIENNNTVPVILTDQDGNILYHRNFDPEKANNPKYILKELEGIKKVRPPLVFELSKNNKNFIYYKESLILQKLTVYPYVQLSVIILFVLIAYVAFSSSRKAEQNKVWLGLSRETAHQLGTPTSSLMAWIEILKDKVDDCTIIDELQKDVNRLNIITERFSKIGSQPKLIVCDLNKVVEDVVIYMQKRASSSIDVSFERHEQVILTSLNVNLFSWVIENLIKNSLDAIEKDGFIKTKVFYDKMNIIIDVEDNGKGIHKRNIKKLFKPGYTTKMRGWGLGLSLTKRIIEEYHKGKIFVLHSEINKGTTFRIMLRNN